MPPASVAVRLSRWDEHWLDPEAQAYADDAGQVFGRRPPTGELAAVVELQSSGTPKRLPALTQEDQDFVYADIHASGTRQSQANDAVEHIAAHQDVEAFALAFEMDPTWPHASSAA